MRFLVLYISLWTFTIPLVRSERTKSGPPKCVFPEYLQTTESKPWILNHTQTVVTYYVEQDEIIAHDCRKDTRECSEYRRLCTTKFDDDRFLVQHIESDFTDRFLCLRFFFRSRSVVQVSTSHIKSGSTNRYLCRDQWLSLDPWPWISHENSIFEKVGCPFSGGYNFELFFNSGLMRREQKCSSSIPPVRVESDCTEGEGMVFRFRNKKCLHDEGNLDIVQKASCIAAWQRRGDSFAILMKNEDRYFWCVRVQYAENGDVARVYIFLDIICQHEDVSSHTERYIELSALEKRNITNVCTDEFYGCQVSDDFCSTETRDVCPRSCGQCNSNDTLRYCFFPPSIHGKWVKSTLRGNQHIEIGNSSLTLPQLGKFHCVTFNSTTLPLRRVLLQQSSNGCYPRFTCFQYDTPSPAVMRFRTSAVLMWPVQLSDSRICDDKNFKDEVNPRIPQETLHQFPLESIVRKAPEVQYVSCNLPKSMQKVSSFRDDRGGRGCLVHGAFSAPRRIFLSYMLGERVVQRTTYNCIGSLTYISSYKSIIISVAKDQNGGDASNDVGVNVAANAQNYLCWIVVGRREIIQVPGASCNTFTAERIVEGDNDYSNLLMKKFYLTNDASGCFANPETKSHLAQDWTVPPPFQQIRSQSSRLDYPFPFLVVLLSTFLFSQIVCL